MWEIVSCMFIINIASAVHMVIPQGSCDNAGPDGWSVGQILLTQTNIVSSPLLAYNGGHYLKVMDIPVLSSSVNHHAGTLGCLQQKTLQQLL